MLNDKEVDWNFGGMKKRRAFDERKLMLVHRKVGNSNKIFILNGTFPERKFRAPAYIGSPNLILSPSLEES